MAKQSSAKFVSYDLRPSKQIERKMMLDSFYAAMEAGFSISKYRYVGMGGNRFYDFILIHKYLGIEVMVSLEHANSMFPRAIFNSPYSFIEVRNDSVQGFISSDSFQGNSIYWMDYDNSLQPEITRDIASLAPKINSGDFVFFTVCAEPSRNLQKLNNSVRYEEIRDMFGDLAGDVLKSDMENSNFPSAVHKILRAGFTNAFNYHHAGKFFPYFQIVYADGKKMMTYGGLFSACEENENFHKALCTKVPIFNNLANHPYQINRFNLTEKERNLFDLASTTSNEDAQELVKLDYLGFKKCEVEKYRELLRYHPRYVETLR